MLTPEIPEAVRFLGDLAVEARLRCQSDLLYFGSDILGYDYLERPADFHREAAKAIEDREEFLLLAPRIHIKTTICNVVGSAFEIVRDPDVRILLTHDTLDNAKRILRESTDHFRDNQRLRRLFPEIVPDGRAEDPTLTSFTTKARSRPRKEPTIMAGAPGATVTGMHFDVIQATDLVNEQNVPPNASPEQMERTKEFYGTFLALLDQTNPKARRQVNGTRWHDSDLYGALAEDEELRRIIVGIPDDEDGNPIAVWDMIPAERLRRIKNDVTMTPYFWAANFKNDPLPADSAVGFRKEHFKVYETKDLPSALDVAITVDLAATDKKEEKRDRSAIVVSGLSDDMDLFILDAKAGRWRAETVMEQILALWGEYGSIYGVRYIGIESVAFQKMFIYWMQERVIARTGVMPPFLKLEPRAASKEARAFPLAAFAANRGIHVRQEHMTDFVPEFLRFPVGKHDDYVDALAYRMQNLRRPGGALPGNLVSQEGNVLVVDFQSWQREQVSRMLKSRREDHSRGRRVRGSSGRRLRSAR